MSVADKKVRRRAFFTKDFTLLCRLFLVCCLLLPAACGENKDSPEDRYLRAVYLLRSFGGPAAAENEEIPRRVMFSDDTESLLHHRDKIFVLRRVADDLARSRPVNPKAPLYEAHARLALGEKRQAVALLMAYVAENEYRREQYALLCENLYSLEEYSSLLLICYEWRERDKECREDRCRLIFTALFNLGRPGEAAAFVREHRSCLAWRAPVYEARALSLLGEERRAEKLVEEALRANPQEAVQMRRLWDILRSREKI